MAVDNIDDSKRPAPDTALGRFARNLCISITLALGLLVAGECAAYFLLQKRVAGYDYEYLPYVIWRVAPSKGSQFGTDDGWRRTTNSSCGDGAFTIWMFGGSGLWGNYNRDHETIASSLAKYYEDSGEHVCVRNYGQRGWTNTQEVIQLMLELKRVPKAPDLVLFYDGTVDAAVAYESNGSDVHQGYARFKQKFESWGPGHEAGFSYLGSTNTYLALRWLAERLHSDPVAPPPSLSEADISSIARRTLDNYSQNRRIVSALAARYHFRYVFLVEPFLLTADKPLSAAESAMVRRRRQDDGTKVVRAIYAAFRARQEHDFVYLGDVFRGRSEQLFTDPQHLGATGSQLMASSIYQIARRLEMTPNSVDELDGSQETGTSGARSTK
jgi:lysophospholipase L1-like esterase